MSINILLEFRGTLIQKPWSDSEEQQDEILGLDHYVAPDILTVIGRIIFEMLWIP